MQINRLPSRPERESMPESTGQTEAAPRPFRKIIAGVYLSVIFLACIGAGLTALTLEIQAAVRAYVTAESLWSKAQKEAVYRLDRFASTGEPSELAQASEMLEVPLADLRARRAMEQQPPAREAAIGYFIKGQAHPDDAPRMVWLFLYFRQYPNLSEAVDYWRESDPYILRLGAIANEMEAYSRAGPADARAMDDLRAEVNRIAGKVRPLQDGFSAALGQGSRSINLTLKAASVAVIAALSLLVSVVFRWATRRISESERKFRDTFEQAGMGMAQMSADGKLTATNYSLCDLLGYTPAELVGQPLSKLLDSDQDLSGLPSLLKDREDRPSEEYKFRSRDGKALWCRLSVSKIDASWKGKQHLILEVLDITESRDLMNRLQYQARHDALTGTINRYEFEEQLRVSVQDARLQGSHHALCFIDLDQFKVLNDTAGHLAGDEALQEVSRLLRSELRRSDILARLGGDEFGVILRDCEETVAGEVTEKLRRIIESYVFRLEGIELRLGASIGWVPIDGTTTDARELLKAADTACFMAKDYGRNRVFRHSPEDHDLQSRHSQMAALSQIRAALESDRMVLYAQEVQSISADKLPSFEVLVRMLDSQGNLVLPGAFLPAAERFHIAADIDRWVVRATLETLSRHPQQLSYWAYCHINLSGQSIGREDFLTFLEQTLDQSPVDPGKLCFEITETATITNLADSRDFFQRIGQRGCVFALDDFGSGLSSFEYLTSLPVDIVKIDGVFVRDVLDNPVHQAIVKSICEINSLMNKSTVAEFVETDAIRDCVASLGINGVQGYGIHRPCPFEELLQRFSRVDSESQARPTANNLSASKPVRISDSIVENLPNISNGP